MSSTRNLLVVKDSAFVQAPELSELSITAYKQFLLHDYPRYKHHKGDQPIFDCLSDTVRDHLVRRLTNTTSDDLKAKSNDELISEIDKLLGTYSVKGSLDRLKTVQMSPGFNDVNLANYNKEFLFHLRIIKSHDNSVPKETQLVASYIRNMSERGLQDMLLALECNTLDEAMTVATRSIAQLQESIDKCKDAGLIVTSAPPRIRHSDDTSRLPDFAGINVSSASPRVRHSDDTSHSSESTPPERPSAHTISCDRCGKLGHLLRSCTIDRDSCHCSYCHRVGHLALACRLRKKHEPDDVSTAAPTGVLVPPNKAIGKLPHSMSTSAPTPTTSRDTVPAHVVQEARRAGNPSPASLSAPDSKRMRFSSAATVFNEYKDIFFDPEFQDFIRSQASAPKEADSSSDKKFSGSAFVTTDKPASSASSTDDFADTWPGFSYVGHLPPTFTTRPFGPRS